MSMGQTKFKNNRDKRDGKQLVLLPRVVDLMADFGHAVKIRQTPIMAHHICDPFVIFDASHYLQRFHHAHMRAAQGSHDMEGAQQLLDRHAELWEASTPVDPASVSGL